MISFNSCFVVTWFANKNLSQFLFLQASQQTTLVTWLVALNFPLTDTIIVWIKNVIWLQTASGSDRISILLLSGYINLHSQLVTVKYSDCKQEIMFPNQKWLLSIKQTALLKFTIKNKLQYYSFSLASTA